MMSRWQCPPARWHALLIAATLLVSYSYFPDFLGGWNQNSRFGLTRAIVERHRLYIDGYDRATEDKASREGHFYSDKAPGLALSAVPVWEASRLALRVAHKDPSGPRPLLAEGHVVTVVCVALPGAVAAALLFLMALELGASVSGAGFAAVTFGLTTPFWCYATLFWGHVPSAAYLFFAFAAALSLREFVSPRRDLLLGISVGLAAGWAVVTEFTAAPPAAILVLLALAYAWPSGRTRLFRLATCVAVSALPCVLALMVYNALAFGSLFTLGYSLSAQQNWPLMKQGLMGVTYPKADALFGILLGCYRGLLPIAPLVGAAPLGLRLLWKQTNARGIVLAITAISLYYVLLNASYADWDGGMSYGPRHLAPGLPFLCLPLALLWTRSPSVSRWVLAILAFYGAFLTLVAVSTHAMGGPRGVKFPMQELLWPAFRDGHLSQNLATLAGLQGLASLIPLFLVWGTASAAWVWLRRSPGPKPLEPTAA
jgi:hypothetical protein